MADPVEYTFCRYTPVTTEVRCWAAVGLMGVGCVCVAHCPPAAPYSPPAAPPPLNRPTPPTTSRRTRATLGPTATRCACSTSSRATSSCSSASPSTMRTRRRSARRCSASARCAARPPACPLGWRTPCSARLPHGPHPCSPTLIPCTPVPQNLEVLYRQYGRDGNKNGLDWQEVAVCIIQDGIQNADASVAAASTVQVRPGPGGGELWHAGPLPLPTHPPSQTHTRTSSHDSCRRCSCVPSLTLPPPPNCRASSPRTCSRKRRWACPPPCTSSSTPHATRSTPASTATLRCKS